MSGVTEGQRKAFWAYVGKPGVGENRARRLMGRVTKGIISLRDPRMTSWKMCFVLEAFKYYFGGGPREKKKLVLRTEMQESEILCLIDSLGWNREKYCSLSRLMIGRDEPLMEWEAGRVIREMEKLLKIKKKSKISMDVDQNSKI